MITMISLPEAAKSMRELSPPMLLRCLGQVDYRPAHEAMRAFTLARIETTPDEIWLLEHPAVYTQGLAGRAEHLLDPGDIPVERTERGGQVTFHGPGQWVAYVLIDLRRRRLGVRELVCRLEQALIDTLASHGIVGNRRAGAPGVYVRDGAGAGAKIASLGLKISRGCSFHGLALNVAMDTEPFSRIDPCGYPGLEVTDMRREGARCSMTEAGNALLASLVASIDGRAETGSAIESTRSAAQAP